MAANRLLYEVIRGLWCLDTSNIAGYAPIINKILSGEKVYEKKEIKSVFSYVDEHAYSVEPEKLQSGYAIIEIIGEITQYGDECAYGAADYVKMIDSANLNPRVKGIILKVDGPGGSVGAINPFKEFKSRKKKPIIALSDSACSLHYWMMAELADHIISANDVSARFGSIGVMCTLADVKGAYKKEGIELHEIYAPESENKNEAFRLALEGKYDMIKEEELSPIARKFQGAVRDNRKNLKEEKGVLSGKSFFAEDAKRLGLIDTIGNINDAIMMIEVLNQVKYKSV